MKTKNKPTFEEMKYNPSVWKPIGGSKIKCIEEKKTSCNTETQLAKEIYDNYIKVGSKFRASRNNGKYIAEITYISKSTNKISWQLVVPKEMKEDGYYTVPEKWDLSAMISMYQQDYITFIKE